MYSVSAGTLALTYIYFTQFCGQSDSHNLKYMGIDALGRLIKLSPDIAEQHQLAVIDCMEVSEFFFLCQVVSLEKNVIYTYADRVLTCVHILFLYENELSCTSNFYLNLKVQVMRTRMIVPLSH